MLVTKQLTVVINFHVIFSILWKSMATINFGYQHSSKYLLFCLRASKTFLVPDAIRNIPRAKPIDHAIIAIRSPKNYRFFFFTKTHIVLEKLEGE